MSSPEVVYPPPGYNYTPYYNNPAVSGPQFNPTIAVIIIVLIGGCFVLGFISVFVRKCMTDETAMRVRSSRTTSGTRTLMTWAPKSRGLDQNSVDALPIVHRKDLNETDDFECPVCLTEFEPEDSLRLLPVCKHVFHQDCIDAWFESHSTCPLCRASLTLRVEWPERREPGESAAEVSENRDSDRDVGLQPVHDAHREDSQIDVVTLAPPPSAVISPEDERNSARVTLSRHSQSFKCEAGSTTALEKAASPEAQSSKPSTAPGSKKPPLTPSSTTSIRRASSVGTDLIALRNLLTGGDQNASVNSYRLDRARTAVPKVDAPVSTSWFARPQSTDLGAREQTPENGHSSPSAAREKWSSVDLEFGNRSTAGASISKGESSTSAVPESARSDRWSLASLRSAMFPLSRSTSDVTPNANLRLPG